MATAQWPHTLFRVELIAQAICPGPCGADHHRRMQLNAGAVLLVLHLYATNLIVSQQQLVDLAVVKCLTALCQALLQHPKH